MNAIDKMYNDVSLMYERDRDKNARTEERRRAEIFRKIPRIEEIENFFVNSGVELARIALKAKDPETRRTMTLEYKAKTDDLILEKKQLLRINGYPEDYLDPIYTCPICRDTGNDGMKKCSCFNKRLIESNYAASGVSGLLENENFDSFDLKVFSDKAEGDRPSPRENAANILACVKDIVSKTDREHPCSLIFSGRTGVGKTFFCNCAAKALLDKGLSLYYVSAFRLFNDISNSHFDHNKENDGYSDTLPVLTCDVLVIDDLGAEIITSVTIAYFTDIINQRIRNGLSTIISTNYLISEIFKTYGERVGSRFAQYYRLFRLYGEDIRLK